MLLARSKVKYYGAYPAGFLQRARDLLGVGINDPVLHVCSGRIRDYPFGGLGPNDRTLDLDPEVEPDFGQDARQPYPLMPRLERTAAGAVVFRRRGLWAAVLADPPYTPEDAAKYRVGADVLPTARQLLLNGLDAVRIGGKVGILHYVAPRPPKDRARFAGLYTVVVGYENRPRLFSVYERKR
jgi:hypothetical protein